MKHERRKRKRVPFIIETDFETSDGLKIHPRVYDISMSGILLQTSQPLRQGQKGKIKIFLECGEVRKILQAACKVVRIINPSTEMPVGGAGLEITEMDSDSSIILFNIIRYQDKE